MRPIYWKCALTMVAGALAGLLGGQATIAGMAPPPARTSTALAETVADTSFGPDSYADANPGVADDSRTAAACENCSDYDLGYRFAAARGLRTTTDCLDYSWSYQRGCLAYVREG